MLTPYPGTPMFKQLEPLLTETRLGEVRRLHADVPPPEPHRARAAVPARRRVQAVLHAAVVSRELPEDSEHGHPRVGEPDGPARQRSALARGDRRHLASRRMLTRDAAEAPTAAAEEPLCGSADVACGRYARHDAGRHLALWSASLSRNRRHRRGCKARGEFIQGPQIAEFEAAFAARQGCRRRHADHRRVRTDGVLLHPEGAGPAGRLRDHLSVADLLGRAGAGARRGTRRSSSPTWTRRRSTWIRRRSSG